MTGKSQTGSLKFLQACSLLLCIFPAKAAPPDASANWPAFRNGGSSTVTGSLPESWTETEGITWQTETDGYGQSAPIVYANHVFVTSVIGLDKDTCAVSSFDLSSGKLEWQLRLPSSQEGPSNYMYSRAAPTPVADINAVYAFFETGNLTAVDYSGQQLWHRDLTKEAGTFDSNHGIGASLAQTENLIILNIEHKGPSFLIGINKHDGTTRWKVNRPSGSSWTSPIVIDRFQLAVVSSAGSLTGYDAGSGMKRWSLGGLEGNSVPSPCAVGSRVIVGARVPEFGSAAEAARSNLCVHVPDGNTDGATVEWRAETAVCDYASPVVADNRVYFLNKVGVLSCVDARTGAGIYRERLRAECWATPIVSDNGIYFFSRDGTVKVIERGQRFRVLATNRLWNPDDPPAPETYRERERSGHGHGSGRPGGGMIAGLMKGDVNGDGILQTEEVAEDFRPMLKRVDTNGDGSLDATELQAMAKSFAERRRHSRQASRDPIVYGVAAVPGTICVRTGTRLYCVADHVKRISEEGER